MVFEEAKAMTILASLDHDAGMTNEMKQMFADLLLSHFPEAATRLKKEGILPCFQLRATVV